MNKAVVPKARGNKEGLEALYFGNNAHDGLPNASRKCLELTYHILSKYVPQPESFMGMSTYNTFNTDPILGPITQAFTALWIINTI